MSEANLIEKFGLAFEAEGMPRIAGRIVGFMMLQDGACSLDDLAERLMISKTSASTNTRLLEQHGFLDRVAKPGDRRDYYQMATDPGERLVSSAKRRMENFRKLVTEAADAVPPSRKETQGRLRSLCRFYEFLLDDFEDRMRRWRTTEKNT